MNDINAQRVLLALRNLPSQQVAGGPIAAARLLGNALFQYRHLLENCYEVLFLEDKRIRPLQDLLAYDNPIVPIRKKSVSIRKNMWDRLEKQPNSLWLNLLHSLSLKVRSYSLSQVLSYLVGRDVVQSFIVNLSYALLHRRDRAYRVVHSEHSKGGWSREYSMLYPFSAGSHLIKRMKEMEALVAEYSDILIFPSRGAYQLFQEWHSDLVRIQQDKVRIIYTGLDDLLEKVSGHTETERKVILNVAHHVPEKRVDVFVKSVDEFKKNVGIAKRQFVAINYGSFTHLTPSLSVSDEVHFKGLIAHNELIKEMSTCWVLVSVPEVAVFDLVILEAMSLGKPVVASKVGGNVEALGEDYPLYASEPGEIADILLELSQNRMLYQEVSRRNRERYLELFTLEAFTRRHIEVWRELNSD